MPTTNLQLTQLKRHLSAHHRASAALAAATTRLHRSLDRVVNAAEKGLRAGSTKSTKKKSSAKPPKAARSGDSAGLPAEAPSRGPDDATVSAPASLKPKRAPPPSPAASLERHWGNLF